MDSLPREVREAYEIHKLLKNELASAEVTHTPTPPINPQKPGTTPDCTSPLITPAQAQRKPYSIAGVQRREACLHILCLYDEFQVKTGMKKTRAITLFCEIYNTGTGTSLNTKATIWVGNRQPTLDTPEWVRQVRPTVSPNTLRSWDKARRRGESLALAGRYGHRASTGQIDRCGALCEFLAGVILENSDITARLLRKAAEVCFGAVIKAVGDDGLEKEIALPGIRTIQRWCAAWRAANPELIALATNPDGWRNGYRLALGTANTDVTQPNDLWEMDASPTDMLLNDGRYRVYVVIDVYPRRLSVLITRTCSTEAALLALRKAIREWGKCKRLRFDNGADFKSREFLCALGFLGIEPDPCDVYSPEQKPMVERAIKTFNHELVVMQPGYIGHSVADRKRIEARRSFAERLGQTDREAFCVELDRDELQRRADAWSMGDYGLKGHEGLGGRTPAEVSRPFLRDRVDIPDEILRLLLAPVPRNGSRPLGIRTVNRDVGIQVEGGEYPEFRARWGYPEAKGAPAWHDAKRPLSRTR
ncbi:hypothetical protein J2852_006326, partial [Azospirillum soli]|nr:hypothetical protein [Azospirillum soli]